MITSKSKSYTEAVGWKCLNQQSTKGKNPVHLAADTEFQFLAVSNYGSGSVALLPLNADGTIGELVDLVDVPGQQGPHRVEQPHARPHHIPFDRDGRFMVVPDSRPITIVVPFFPGGGVDTVARLLAEKMRASLKQTVLVENKPGGGAMIGAGAVARSEPDGYTMLLGTAGEMAIAPHIHKNMRYQPEKDFAPLALIAKVPNVMVVNASLPVKSVDELVGYAKKTRGGVTYSTSGVGNMQHLNGELFNKLAGTNMLHVPYKGAAGQLQDVVSGEVNLSFVSYAAAKGFIEGSKLRAIGVTSSKRAGFAPNIPAIRESAGLSSYQLDNWFGLFLPAGTPEPVQGCDPLCSCQRDEGSGVRSENARLRV